MDEHLTGRMGARHLSQIKEESDSREHSTCFLPPIGQKGGAGKTGVDQAERRELKRSSLAQCEQQKKVEDKSLLEELGRIEAELRLDVERQQEAASQREQKNQLLQQSLLYLSLNQRVTKPWVSSYFRTFPMHIYCLPVQRVVSHTGRRWGLKKSR